MEIIEKKKDKRIISNEGNDIIIAEFDIDEIISINIIKPYIDNINELNKLIEVLNNIKIKLENKDNKDK